MIDVLFCVKRYRYYYLLSVMYNILLTCTLNTILFIILLMCKYILNSILFILFIIRKFLTLLFLYSMFNTNQTSYWEGGDNLTLDLFFRMSILMLGLF